MPTTLKNHYASYMGLFTTPSVDKSVTFYEIVKFSEKQNLLLLHSPHGSYHLILPNLTWLLQGVLKWTLQTKIQFLSLPFLQRK